MTEFIPQALRQIIDPPKPATPAEARPDGKRVFPNVPCMTDGCAGDLGHEGDCGPRPVAS
jgi:hypothetical protein